MYLLRSGLCWSYIMAYFKIDCFVFYAVSAIFQPLHGGRIERHFEAVGVPRLYLRCRRYVLIGCRAQMIGVLHVVDTPIVHMPNA